MEVYVLDKLLRRTEVVDVFESLIWTERWREIGDFELDLESTIQNRRYFTVGTQIAINKSLRVMTVETVEDNTNAEGKELLRIKGRSLEALLEDRVIKKSMANLAVEPSWTIVETPGNVARKMFDHICRNPAGLDRRDLIPFLVGGSMLQKGNIPEIETLIKWEQEPDLLYTAIVKICEMYDLGFRLVRDFDASRLYFDVYSGNNHTTKQRILPPVIFSVSLDNIQNTTEFSTIHKSKNVAYVFSEVGVAVVYGENVDPDVEGFERRVLVVNATNIGTENVNAALIQQGNEALLQHRASMLFDGEINQRGEYIYGVHYELGDLVDMRNKDDVVTYNRVTEQIFVDDSNGERSYPTLEMDLFAGVNTWLSWSNSKTVWADFTGETWTDM